MGKIYIPFYWTTQGDGDDIIDVPLDTKFGPLTFEAVLLNIMAVAGSPTGITVDVDLTDGTVTRAALAAAALGTAAARIRHAPSAADQENGNHIADQEDMVNGSNAGMWRVQVDLNFTAGSTPTITGDGILVFRE